ncbi:UNVERIFIED_CONTAM: hypothetical protein Sradi_7127100 [Sesamum radiatum]|uniref:Uncharacterized protein n=1 Tax=Sesamum radiatum TaxID=300843 RepID=A0AAW2IYR4_SESRA
MRAPLQGFGQRGARSNTQTVYTPRHAQRARVLAKSVVRPFGSEHTVRGSEAVASKRP